MDVLFNRIAPVFVAPALWLVAAFSFGETSPYIPLDWPAPPEQQLAIKGIGGSIAIDSMEGNTMEVTAITNSKSGPILKVMESNGSVAVCATYACEVSKRNLSQRKGVHPIQV